MCVRRAETAERKRSKNKSSQKEKAAGKAAFFAARKTGGTLRKTIGKRREKLKPLRPDGIMKPGVRWRVGTVRKVPFVRRRKAAGEREKSSLLENALKKRRNATYEIPPRTAKKKRRALGVATGKFSGNALPGARKAARDEPCGGWCNLPNAETQHAEFPRVRRRRNAALWALTTGKLAGNALPGARKAARDEPCGAVQPFVFGARRS